MTFGEKVAKLRRQKNYTQEQLAELLEVSRQSVSKWESDLAFPETDKLIKMGKLFDCSMDYLLKDDLTEERPKEHGSVIGMVSAVTKELIRERKSTRTVMGLPLYHVGANAKGFFAVGVNATGVFAVGLKAKGLVSLGLLSTGVLAFGLLSLGLAAFGVFALGLLGVGAVALGLVSAGAFSFGILSFGAVSFGCFASGALVNGRYIAVGFNARGDIAIGEALALGKSYFYFGSKQNADLALVRRLLDGSVPAWLNWAKELFWLYLSA